MVSKHLKALAVVGCVSLAACASSHSVTVPVQSASGRLNLDASLTLPKGDGPFPAVVFMHGCGGVAKGFTAPTTVMIGDLDDWTPAELCEEMAEETKVQLRVYDGAYHGFDRDEPVQTVMGCCSNGRLAPRHIGNNSAADRQSHSDLDDFLRSLP